MIEDYIPILTPPQNVDLPVFNPHHYFITSGDAISKAKQLSKDLWQYAGVVRKTLNGVKRKRREIKQFEKECWRSAGGATTMINALKTARGDAVFMETEWRHHSLLCIPKNPKIKRTLEAAAAAAEAAKATK